MRSRLTYCTDRKGKVKRISGFIGCIGVAALMSGGCTTSKLQYSRKADMSTYQKDKADCLPSTFLGIASGWGFTPGQSYRWCMEKRGYTVTTTKPAPLPLPFGDE